MNKKTLRTTGVISLVVGGMLFVFLGVTAIWGELEALFFNAALKSDDPLPSLQCPAVITPNEISTVSGSFNNPTDKSIEMEVRTYVTHGYVTLMDEFITNFTLAPGETKIVEVPITAQNAAYKNLILVRMHQMKRIPLPYLNASCGIVVINTPNLTGTQFMTLIISMGAILSIGGIILWAFNAKPIVWNRLKIFRALIIFIITSFSITLISLLNWWVLALMLTVIWIFMTMGMIYQFSLSSREQDAQ